MGHGSALPVLATHAIRVAFDIKTGVFFSHLVHS